MFLLVGRVLGILEIYKGGSIMDMNVGYYGTAGCKEYLLIRDGWKCHYCGHHFSISMDGWNNMSIDHKIPQSSEEEIDINHPDNLVIACTNCNSAKSNKIIDDSFKVTRAAASKRDDQWVKERYDFVNESFLSKKAGYPTEFPWSSDYINKLSASLAKKPDYFTNIKIKDNDWPYIDFFNNGNEWTFTPGNFALQPFFIWKQENLIKEHIISDILDMKGYLAADYRSKYMKPFVTIETGIEQMIFEIDWINALLALWNKGKDM